MRPAIAGLALGAAIAVLLHLSAPRLLVFICAGLETVEPA